MAFFVPCALPVRDGWSRGLLVSNVGCQLAAHRTQRKWGHRTYTCRLLERPQCVGEERRGIGLVRPCWMLTHKLRSVVQMRCEGERTPAGECYTVAVCCLLFVFFERERERESVSLL